MREVSIFREKGFYGIFRGLKLFIDDEHVATIKQGKHAVIEVPDQARVLVGKMDWARTEAFPLDDIADGDTLNIKSWFTLNPFRNIGISTLPMSIRRSNK